MTKNEINLELRGIEKRLIDHLSITPSDLQNLINITKDVQILREKTDDR